MATLKEKISSGKTVLGTWCIMASEQASNVAAKAGLDFIIIDMEHGSMGFETAQRMVFSAQAEGCAALIRINSLSENDVQNALETGADGIVAPHIETPEQAKLLVEYSKYPPEGKRGFSPYARGCGYHLESGTCAAANRRTVLVAIVEGKAGLSNVQKISSIHEIDVVYVGTYDISSMLGIPGQVEDARVMKILKQACGGISKEGKAAGCMSMHAGGLATLKSIGAKFLVFGVDTAGLFNYYKTAAGSK